MKAMYITFGIFVLITAAAMYDFEPLILPVCVACFVLGVVFQIFSRAETDRRKQTARIQRVLELTKDDVP